MKLVSSEVSECADALQEKALQLMEVEHLQGYLTWLKRIMELRYGSVEEGGRGGRGREGWPGIYVCLHCNYKRK